MAWIKSFLQKVTVSEIKPPQNSTEVLIVQEMILVFLGFFVVLFKFVIGNQVYMDALPDTRPKGFGYLAGTSDLSLGK